MTMNFTDADYDTPNRRGLIEQYGLDELSRVITTLYRMDQDGHITKLVKHIQDKDLTAADLAMCAVFIWAGGRDTMNSVLMHEIDPEATLAEVLMSFDRAIDIMTRYDGPAGQAPVHALAKTFAVLKRIKGYENIVRMVLRSAMQYAAEQPT